jgi:hypothetical protein
MIDGMSQPSPPARVDDEQRPTVLLLVYSWDMFLAILAIFGALAPFAGQVALGARLVAVPVALQILGALSSAAYAAVLIIVASLLTRHLLWVKRMQMWTMALAILFAVVSIAIGYGTGGIDLTPVLVTALFVLIDLLMIVVMTEKRVVLWFGDSARTPRYAFGTLGFWALTSVALILVDAIR